MYHPTHFRLLPRLLQRAGVTLMLVFTAFFPSEGQDIPSASQFLLGTAQVDITPPTGWRMAGNYYEQPNNGVHDPLFVKAMVFQQGETMAALAICDICSVPRPLTDLARQKASRTTGIPPENIAIAATHTHAGPEYFGMLRDFLHQKAIREHGSDPREPLDYQAFLVDSWVKAIEEAHSQMKAVDIEAGIARQKGLAFNRRFHMKDGSVQFNPGKKNPNIVRAAGPVDEDLPILFFRDAADRHPQASLTSFAMHTAVFGGDRFGADFPGILQSNLRERWGKGFFSLYGMGAAGDVNHFNVDTDRPDPDSEAIADTLTETILQAIPTLQPLSQLALAAQSRWVTVPLVDITADRVGEAWRIYENQEINHPSFLELVEAWKVINTQALKERGGDGHRMEVQAIRFDVDTVLVLWPHEIFVELGMAVKERSPFQNTIFISLANDFDFYIPTRKAFAEGSYEIVTSSVQPGAGEALVEETIVLLNEMKLNKP